MQPHARIYKTYNTHTEGKRKHKSKAALLAAAQARATTTPTHNPTTTSTTTDNTNKHANSKIDVSEEAWQAALLRARGEKVLDDTKLLRKSLKREAKAKQKSREAWKQRVQKQNDEQAARQQRYEGKMGGVCMCVLFVGGVLGVWCLRWYT